jgi:hypothetical protein
MDSFGEFPWTLSWYGKSSVDGLSLQQNPLLNHGGHLKQR